MKKLSTLALVIFFVTQLNAWQQLRPAKTDNEFERKQSELIGLSGVFKKITLDKNEKLTIQTRTIKKSESEEIVIFGADSPEVEIFVYHYPGRYQRNRKENVTELQIRTKNSTKSRFYNRPNSYEKSTSHNSNENKYFEEFKHNDKTVYLLEIILIIE